MAARKKVEETEDQKAAREAAEEHRHKVADLKAALADSTLLSARRIRYENALRQLGEEPDKLTSRAVRAGSNVESETTVVVAPEHATKTVTHSWEDGNEVRPGEPTEVSGPHGSVAHYEGDPVEKATEEAHDGDNA